MIDKLPLWIYDNIRYSSFRYNPPEYDLDRYDKPIDRPIYSEITIYRDPPPNFPRPPSSYSSDSDYHSHRRPPPPPPPLHPSSDEYLGPYRPPPDSFGYRPVKKPDHYPHPHPNYLDRERESVGPPPPNYKPSKLPSQPFIPYTINKDAWASYGGSYGGGQHYNQQAHDFWGLPNDNKRNDVNFNYFDLGNGQKFNPNDNAVLSYPGSRYDIEKGPPGYELDKDRNYYGSLWTRRPGQEGTINRNFEC